jgi:hypothetical protein
MRWNLIFRVACVVMTAGFVLLGAFASASAQTWCEQDCRSLCQKTSSSPQDCIAKYQCSQYAGRRCAGAAAVAARAKQYKRAAGGAPAASESCPRGFDACLKQSVGAGWPASQAAVYCQTWCKK